MLTALVGWLVTGGACFGDVHQTAEACWRARPLRVTREGRGAEFVLVRVPSRLGDVLWQNEVDHVGG